MYKKLHIECGKIIIKGEHEYDCTPVDGRKLPSADRKNNFTDGYAHRNKIRNKDL